jgi:hypothetical protein
MKRTIVYIHAILAKEGANDIDLLVHSYYIGRPSPCVVIEDWTYKGSIGGHIESVEEIFQLQVSKHPGYAIKNRQDLIAEVPEEESNPKEVKRK